MWQQLRHSNKSSHQKRGGDGVCLQVVQLGQLPKLGGNGSNEFILRKASAHKWSRKEGKASAMRQQMLYSNNNRIRSVAVTGFAYSVVSFFNFPSSVGMDPLILFLLRSLPARGPKSGKGVSSAAADALR